MREFKVKLAFERSTKGTHLYTASSVLVKSVYIQREAFDGEPPEAIFLTVSCATEK